MPDEPFLDLIHRIRSGDEEASTTVEVLADPRFDIPGAARQASWDASLRVGALQGAAAKAIDRMNTTRKDVDFVIAKLEELEKAHIYIERLNKSVRDLEKRLENSDASVK